MFLRMGFKCVFCKFLNSSEMSILPHASLCSLFKEIISPNIDVPDPINSYSEVYSSSPGCYISSARWFWWICTTNCSIMLTYGEDLVSRVSFCCLLKPFYSIDNLTFLPQILESSPDDAVEPILLNLSIRLRNLQVCQFTLLCKFYSAYFFLYPYAVVSNIFLLLIYNCKLSLIVFMFSSGWKRTWWLFSLKQYFSCWTKKFLKE